MDIIKTDIAIIGGGGAGLRAALAATAINPKIIVLGVISMLIAFSASEGSLNIVVGTTGLGIFCVLIAIYLLILESILVKQ